MAEDLGIESLGAACGDLGIDGLGVVCGDLGIEGMGFTCEDLGAGTDAAVTGCPGSILFQL